MPASAVFKTIVVIPKPVPERGVSMTLRPLFTLVMMQSLSIVVLVLGIKRSSPGTYPSGRR